MLLKLVIFLGLGLACHCFIDDSIDCEGCFPGGTYKCDTSLDDHCVCHAGFYGDGCENQQKPWEVDGCNNGTVAFRSGTLACECYKGFWGRLCEHTDSEVAYLHEMEKDIAQKHCEGKEAECYPPHLQVTCATDDEYYCDEDGNANPFKKCPFPWYCFEAFRNGKCDWECERPECLYDGYECATNRPCAPGCMTESGVCDIQCSLKDAIENFPVLATATTLLEVTLNVSEQYFWNNKNEIIATISEPLRTPLVYDPHYNQELEKNKHSLDKILSRGRRHIPNKEGTTIVTLEMYNHICNQESQCSPSGDVAGSVLAVVGRKERIFADKVSVKTTNKGVGNDVMAVCFLIIALPIVLVGYRVVNAPIWFPPRSENEVPVIWSPEAAPIYSCNRIPTPLHEEAYSLSKISLPIRKECVNGMDEQGRTPLFWLIASRKSSELMLDDMNELMVAGANPNHSDDKGDTPLSIAITAIRPSICNRLVQWGANPASTTHSGASCLHLAVAQDDVKCVQWLLSFPSVKNNINEVDESDRTPLAMTAQGGLASAQIAEILIEAGADVLHQGNHYTMWRYRGRTALHWAALFNNLEVMKVLLHHRSDVNCVDTEGCTSLHLAVQRGSETAARMLLEAHASPEIPNGLGLIPLSIAKKSGNEVLINLLIWYTDVRKEALSMKMKKGKKREKKNSDSGSEYSKRSCSSADSPFFSDSLSNYSGSSGYFFPSMSSDSSSIGSGTSLTSFSSASSYPWSPPPSASSPTIYLVPKMARPPLLSPIEEKPLEYFSLDTVRTEEYIPPGAWTNVVPTKRDNASVGEESGVVFDFDNSCLLSPHSEISNGSCGPESPSGHMGTGYFSDQDKPLDEFNNEELLHEFFVNWQN